MIRIDNLTFTYPGATTPNLRDVTLEVEDGDFLAIIGNNGCGKSTLCKSMIGLIPHSIVGDIEGDIYINDVSTKDMTVGEIACKVGYVYQDFENQIVRPTVLEDAAFACLNYAMRDYEEKGKKALQLCGLYEKEEEYIWQLSGGQKHLLALAGAVALSPDVLILDEPIAQLDPSHARQIYDVLKYLNEEHNKTIIVIEHHTEFIAEYCNHAVLMKEGKVIWKLEAKEAMRRVDELQESNIFPPQVTMAAYRLKVDNIGPYRDVLPTTLEEADEYFHDYYLQQNTLQNDQMQMRYVLDCKKDKQNQDKIMDIKENITGKEVTVSLDNVTVEYRAVKGKPSKIFNQFSLQLHKGEKIALIGSNGAGKSTMMKLMIGLLKPSSGSVLLGDKDTKRYGADELSRIISIVYQNPEEMFIKDSIRDDIAFAMKVRDVENYMERTDELLAMFRLTEIAHRDGRLLSGGQMRRASLAIGVALYPQILLLDEPTANLDIATRKEIMNLLKEMKDVTETVMIATHDMQLVCEWAERVIVITGGELIADGTVDEVFGNEFIMKRVGIRPPEIFECAKRMNSSTNIYTIDAFVESMKGGYTA